MLKKYQLKQSPSYVNDEASVKFHVENNDYFGTIAAVLSLVKEQIKKDDYPNSAILNKILKDLETDLLILQKEYQINPKNKNKNKIPKGKLINQ